MQTAIKPGADDVAKAFLDAKLQELALSVDDLAGQCGWSRHAFLSQRTAGFPCLPLRWKIEAALGFRAVWSSAAEAEIRERCFDAYGIDPRTAPLRELITLCRRLGVPSSSSRRQDEWQANLLAWLAVNRKTQNERK
jgi:hypothetical protein